MADYQELAMAMSELVVTVGIIEAAVGANPDVPEEVKENLSAKVQTLVEHIHSEILEFQQFGEAFDGEG